MTSKLSLLWTEGSLVFFVKQVYFTSFVRKIRSAILEITFPLCAIAHTVPEVAFVVQVPETLKFNLPCTNLVS